MNKSPVIRNGPGHQKAEEATRAKEQEEFERRIESRSNALAKLIAGMAKSSSRAFLCDPASFDAEWNQLLIQEARLRWLVRVAKYSEGRNREMLWHTAEELLHKLEQAAEPVSHAKCA